MDVVLSDLLADLEMVGCGVSLALHLLTVSLCSASAAAASLPLKQEMKTSVKPNKVEMKRDLSLMETKQQIPIRREIHFCCLPFLFLCYLFPPFLSPFLPLFPVSSLCFSFCV